MFDDIEGLTPELKAVLESKISETFVSKEEFEKLKEAKEELLTESKSAKRRKDELEAEAERIRIEAATKAGDIESLRNSYEAKLAELNGQITKYNDEKKQQSISGIAKDFVVSNVIEDEFVREAITREFASRLDLRDGQVVVLDAGGNLTANTVEDLQKEFLTASRFAKHLVGTRATGGGATSAGKTTAGGSRTKTLADIPLSDTKARLALIRSKLNS